MSSAGGRWARMLLGVLAVFATCCCVSAGELNLSIVNGILFEGSFPETLVFRMTVRDSPNGATTSQYFDLSPVYIAEVTGDGQDEEFIFYQELNKPDFVANCSESFSTESGGTVQSIRCMTRLTNGALYDSSYMWYEKGRTITFPITDYKHHQRLLQVDHKLLTDWDFQNKPNKLNIKIRFYSSDPLDDNGIPYPQPDALAWNTNLFSKGPIGGGVNLTVLTFADVDGEQTFYRRSSFELPGLVDGTETWDDLHTYDNVIEFDSFESYLDFDPDFSILVREEEDGNEEEKDFGGLGVGGLAALVTCLVVLLVVLIIVAGSGYRNQSKATAPLALMGRSDPTFRWKTFPKTTTQPTITSRVCKNPLKRPAPLVGHFGDAIKAHLHLLTSACLH